MGLINLIFDIFIFLSSFIGFIILITILYFTIGLFEELFLIASILGIILIYVIMFLTRTSSSKINRFKKIARKEGIKRSYRNAFANAIRNRLFSGHIARAFLLGGIIIFFYDYLFMVPIIIFCSFTILAMMRIKQVSLMKIILSSILGTISGVTGVIISNFFF